MNTNAFTPGHQMPVETTPGRVVINNEQPLDTADLREHPVFLAADPEGIVPNVTLAAAQLDPRDRPHRNEQRVGIHDSQGVLVGTLNLAQRPDGGATWFRDVKIESDRQGERLGVAAYLGLIAVSHDVGRRVRSDPAGLSPNSSGDSPARHVWESLVRRGVAEIVPGQQDQHGNPRFISTPPEAK